MDSGGSGSKSEETGGYCTPQSEEDVEEARECLGMKNRKMQLSGTTQDDLFLRRRRRRVIQLQPKQKPKLPKR
eukprot:scaffold35475_cov266-Skeletonema_dohrnii-CCMP3373.AAC.3